MFPLSILFKVISPHIFKRDLIKLIQYSSDKHSHMINRVSSTPASLSPHVPSCQHDLLVGRRRQITNLSRQPRHRKRPFSDIIFEGGAGGRGLQFSPPLKPTLHPVYLAPYSPLNELTILPIPHFSPLTTRPSFLPLLFTLLAGMVAVETVLRCASR